MALLQKDKAPGKEPSIVRLNLPSNDPTRPLINDEEGNFHQILESVLKKDEIAVLPQYLAAKYSHQVEVMKSTFLKPPGLMYLGRSLAATFDADNEHSVTEKVLFDICIISPTQPTVLLTVTKDKTVTRAYTSDDVIRYNRGLSKLLLRSLRRFSDEKISLLHGVLTIEDVHDVEAFKTVLKHITQTSGQFCNPLSLAMNEPKFHNITKALIAAVCINRQVILGKGQACLSDDLHVLSRIMFMIIHNYIDRPLVKFVGSPNVLHAMMIEIARRLQRSGKTALVFHTSTEVENLSHLKICSLVTKVPSFSLKGFQPDIKHIVAEVSRDAVIDQTRVQRTGHLWIFVPNTDQCFIEAIGEESQISDSQKTCLITAEAPTDSRMCLQDDFTEK